MAADADLTVLQALEREVDERAGETNGEETAVTPAQQRAYLSGGKAALDVAAGGDPPIRVTRSIRQVETGSGGARPSETENAAGEPASYGSYQVTAENALNTLQKRRALRNRIGLSDEELARVYAAKQAMGSYYDAIVLDRPGRVGGSGQWAEMTRADLEGLATGREELIAKFGALFQTVTGTTIESFGKLIDARALRVELREDSRKPGVVGGKARHKLRTFAENRQGFYMLSARQTSPRFYAALVSHADEIGAASIDVTVDEVRARCAKLGYSFDALSERHQGMLIAWAHNHYAGNLRREHLEGLTLIEADGYVQKFLAVYDQQPAPERTGSDPEKT